MLRDDAARQQLIAELESVLAAGGMPAAQDTPPEGADAATETVRTFGRQIAELTQAGADRVIGTARDVWRQILLMPQTLDGLMDAIDPQVVIGALVDLGVVIVATVGAFLVLRLPMLRLDRALAERARGAGWPQVILSALLSTVIGLAVILLAWAAGYALTIAFYQGFGTLQIRQALYLNAFLTVGLAKVAGRLVLAPRVPELRLIGLTNEAASALWSWFNTVTLLLGYGILLAVPIASSQAGFFAGAALETTLSVIAVIYTVIRLWRARRTVARWLNKDVDTITDDDVQTPLLARLAALWHWPVLAYLLVVLTLVIARPGGVLLPLLKASGMVMGALLGGLVIGNLLNRAARNGVNLPPYLKYRLPMLELRLNGMLPKILFGLRLLLIVVVVMLSLDFAGLYDIGAWLTTPAAAALVARLSGVVAILAVATVIWLSMASWVEYRLNPAVGRIPTPRETTLLTLLRNAATIALLLLTLMFVLAQIGLNIGPLLASAGVLGLAIGFGAQKMVQDIITGIFIQFENAINVGDVVTVGGTTGVVEKLTVRSVSLRDLEGVFHIVPFSSVDMVSNYTKEFAYHLADIGIAYREDLAEAKQAMFDAFEQLRADADIGPLILDDLQWFGLDSFGDSAIVLRARIKTRPGEQWGVGRAFNAIVKEVFDARGIEIPFPHQTIYFGEDKRGKAPPVHVVTEPAAPGNASPAPERPATKDPEDSRPRGPDMPASDDADAAGGDGR